MNPSALCYLIQGATIHINEHVLLHSVYIVDCSIHDTLQDTQYSVSFCEACNDSQFDCTEPARIVYIDF